MRVAVLLIPLMLSPVALFADEAPPSDACSAPEYHALDFWIGSWRVATPDGRPAGTNRIERSLGDCILLEHWSEFSADGNRAQLGLGAHRYDRAIGRWRQAWMMDTGTTYDMIGRWQDRQIVYERIGSSGRVAGRTTITPLPDGRVDQLGERWDEKSQAWQTTFHLIYTREK